MNIYWNKRKCLHEKRVTSTGLVWDTNMAAVSLFWDTKMAAVTSCENALEIWINHYSDYYTLYSLSFFSLAKNLQLILKISAT